MKNLFQALLCVLLTLPLTVEAQKQIRCESDGGGYNHCRVRLDRGDDVRITKKHSKASCNRGDSWGLDRSGIWVDRGCRADFYIDSDYRRDSYQDHRYNNHRYDRDRYIDRGRRNHDSHFNGGHYNSRHNNRQTDEQHRERRRLINERKKLDAEKRAFERKRRNQARNQGNTTGGCPAGARIGRCSKKERARGCKDWKEADQTPCKSGG